MNVGKVHFFLLAIAALISVLPCVAAKADLSSAYFRLQLRKGETLTTVFSEAISIQGQGFKEIALRISGSASDTVLNPDPDNPAFRNTYRYDARAEGKGLYELRDEGETVCARGRCFTNAESSGLLFNPLLWGKPPHDLQPGTAWKINISQSWELGPPGTETVRVVSLDPVNHVVMLDRWGRGSGESDSEDLHMTDVTAGNQTAMAAIVPGPSHWSGQTVFRHGLILSDVILVERPVTLVSRLGKFRGMEREYTLLNVMPPSR